MPNVQERLKLWTLLLPLSIPHNGTLGLKQLAERFETRAASIINAVQLASLKALSREERFLHQDNLVNGVRKELVEEEKTV